MTILRSKWNLFNSDLSISELIDKFSNSSTNRDNSFGFELLDFNEYHISVKYHEAYLHVDTYFDQYGEEQSIESVRYKFVVVRFCHYKNDVYLIQLENLPRTSMSLFKNLKMTLGKNMSVSDIRFDIESLVERVLGNEDVRQFKIKQASLSSIYLNDKSRAKLEITSTKNALSEFRSNFYYNKYVIDNVKCDFRMNNENLYLELRKTGVISHSKILTGFLNDLIHEELLADRVIVL